MVQMRASKPATGCTMRMEKREDRAPLGKEKSESLSSPKSVLASTQIKS